LLGINSGVPEKQTAADDMRTARFEKSPRFGVIDSVNFPRFWIVPVVLAGNAVAEEGFFSLRLTFPTSPRKYCSTPGTSEHCQGAATMSMSITMTMSKLFHVSHKLKPNSTLVIQYCLIYLF
jgi:hypothetical protein